jgi:hypothetical protein
MISKKNILNTRQILVCVGDPPKKLATKDKIVSLASQKVRLENEQLGVIGPTYLVTQFVALRSKRIR